MGNEKLRIAVVSPDKCKPIKCNLECKIYCPVVRMGKICIDVKKKDKKAEISENLCIGETRPKNPKHATHAKEFLAKMAKSH